MLDRNSVLRMAGFNGRLGKKFLCCSLSEKLALLRTVSIAQ
jgi:hypothetical protein